MYKVVKKLDGDSFLVLDTSDGSKDPCTAKEIYDLILQGYKIEGATIEGKELVIRIDEDTDIDNEGVDCYADDATDNNDNDDDEVYEDDTVDDDDDEVCEDDTDDDDVEYVDDDDDEEYVDDDE